MSGWLTAALWAVGGVTLLGIGIAALYSRKPLRSVLSSGVQGLCALGVVNLLGGFTQVSLGVSWLSAGAAFTLGIPGVIGLLVCKLIFSLG